MTTIVKIGETDEELNVEWRIENFLSLEEDNKFYTSFSFSFAGHSWCMKLYPKGCEEKKSVGYIGLYLRRNSFGSDIKMKFSLGLLTFAGERDPEVRCFHNFQKVDDEYGQNNLLSKHDLLKRSYSLLPAGILTASCSLTHKKFAEDETNDKLLNDLRSIMLSGDHSDTTIKVKGEAFHLHKSILASRNPFFNAMFTCDMKEKTTGAISIDDCEPETFRSFIHFLYTGKVDKLSLESVCDLYELADKYQESQLKKECSRFMVSVISVDSFFDFIILALTHNEKTLLQTATGFFCSKADEITKNVKWQIFTKQNPSLARDLQKAHDIQSADDFDSDLDVF